MASRDIDDLNDVVAGMCYQVVSDCRKQGFDLLVYCTVRTAEEQAKLYRQSRTFSQIYSKYKSLRNFGCDYFARILLDVGPQFGPKVTNAGPGESWHQYRRAFDAVPVVGGKLMWDDSDFQWRVYGEIATDIGLEWAGNWPEFTEYPHCQLLPQIKDASTTGNISNPLKYYSAQESQSIAVINKA